MRILVTGATGTVGRSLVHQAVDAGLTVRALTRDPASARLPAEVEVMAGDLAMMDTVIPALEGVSGLHLIQFAGDDYGRLHTAPDIVAAASHAGVGHITVLGGGEEYFTEEAVQAGDTRWTLLRPGEFMANTRWWADPIRREGVVRAPFANWTSAMIHEADIAEVSLTTLTHPGHHGQIYDLTGPQPLVRKDVVAMIGAAIGKAIRFQELSREETRAQWRAEGMDSDAIEWLLSLGDDDGDLGAVDPAVERVLGKPGRTFAQWIQQHRADFM